jgi:hypothetical protein
MRTTGQIFAGILAGSFGLLGFATQPHARPVVESPELVVTRSGSMETVAMPASGYRDLEIAEKTASFVLIGHALPVGSRMLRGGGINKVSWSPALDGEEQLTYVTLDFSSEPRSSLLNAVEGTPARPRTPQVLLGFIFDRKQVRSGPETVLGSRQSTSPDSAGLSSHGDYRLPKFDEVRYSDALVTLKVVNADFRDVLNLLCQIGGVSYVIDPYYEDEPTGNRRSGKGGGTGGLGGGEGGIGGGAPGFPQDGTGSITLNFNQVPFDQALELLLETAGLVKTDIYPRG